ncbi:MAG: ribonuclease H-like domain-containing protein [Vulcanimicrobiota bacterium]
MDIKQKLALLQKEVDKINKKYKKKKPASQAQPVELPDFIEEETEYGAVYFRETPFPLKYQQGGTYLRETLEAPRHILEFIEPVQDTEDFIPETALFLDTETTGLAGGTGTFPFLIGVGFFRERAFTVRQYFAPDYKFEPAILCHLNKLMKQFPQLVTFNGKAYDMPLINSRMILNRMRPAVAEPVHLDLLHPARRFWKNTIESCSLTSLERNVIGFYREEDIPGFLIPDMYFQYLRDRNFSRLEIVMKHNLFDIVSMAVLLSRMWAHLEKAGADQLKGCEYFNLARIYEKRKDDENALVNYEKAMNLDLPPVFRKKGFIKLTKYYKRSFQWGKAKILWEQMAREFAFEPRPFIELAKYYEHQEKNMEKALDNASHALEIISKRRVLGKNHSTCYQEKDKLQHRINRLMKKMGRNEENR